MDLELSNIVNTTNSYRDCKSANVTNDITMWYQDMLHNTSYYLSCKFLQSVLCESEIVNLNHINTLK